MKLASFLNLPGIPAWIDPIGIEFKSDTTTTKNAVLFYVPSQNNRSDRLYRWTPKTSSWKELPTGKLSQKRRSQLQTFWQAQSESDIASWDAHSKWLAKLRDRMHNQRSA